MVHKYLIYKIKLIKKDSKRLNMIKSFIQSLKENIYFNILFNYPNFTQKYIFSNLLAYQSCSKD